MADGIAEDAFDEMLEDLRPSDAYLEWLERKREQEKDLPTEVDAKVSLTEREANALAGLIEKTVQQFNKESQRLLMSALSKIDKALTDAQKQQVREKLR